MPTYLDISVPIVPGRVPLYPGDARLEVEQVGRLAQGDISNVSRLSCSTHTGTHVDAPAHFLDGAPGVDAVPLDALIGPAYVVDATAAHGPLDAAAVAGLDLPPDAERLLFRTRNSRLWDEPRFVEDFVAFTGDGAQALVDRGVRLVGIDYLSIAPYDDPAPAHLALLRAGVVIVETLDLRGADPGTYHLTCLPLRLAGVDGSPARAVLSRP